MKLSTRVRYGCRALVDLASRPEDLPVSLETMASNQRIPERYLAKIVQDLRRSGLIRSLRGAHGGYVLNRGADQITLLDVWLALEGSLSPVDCLDEPAGCGMWDECVTRTVWEEFRQAVKGVLARHTLASLALAHRRKVARSGTRGAKP